MLPSRRTGKLEPRHDHVGITLMAKALAALPPPPDNTAWVTGPWPMFCNNYVGCCTAAAKALMALHLSRNAQAATLWPDSAVLALYRATSKWDGIAGSPSDVGAVMADVFEHMATVGQQIGLQAPEVISRGVGIDHTDTDTLCRAIAAFGGIDCGWLLTTAMAESTNGRWTYDPASPTEGRHDAIIVNHRTVAGKREFQVVTWTQEFWCDEACAKAQIDEAWISASRQHWLRTNNLTPTGQTFDEALAYAARLAA